MFKTGLHFLDVPCIGIRLLYMGRIFLIREFWQFLRVRKKYWLAPIMFFFILLGALIIFTEGSALAPFIYALF